MVDYLKVDALANTSFEAILDHFSKTPNGNNHTVTLGGTPVRCHRLTKNGEFYEGEMLRIRLDEPAIKCNLSGNETDVLLAPDEGMRESNAFLFSIRKEVLVYQRNRLGVGESKFSGYWADVSGCGSMVLLPIIKPSALSRFTNAASYRTFHIKLAHCRDLGKHLSANGAVMNAVSLAEECNSPSIELRFSVGRKKHSLDRSCVLTWVKSAMGLNKINESALGHLEVSATNEDGTTEVIDLLEEVTKDKITITAPPLKDAFFKARIDGLYDSWKKMRSQLTV